MELRSVIIAPGSPLNEDVARLLLEQFPAEERYAVSDLQEWVEMGIADYRAYLDGDQFVGFSFVIGLEKLAYGMFLATDEKLHSKGYGSRIMDIVAREIVRDRVFCYCIEPPDETAKNAEQRQRRLRFYERLGLKLSGYALDFIIPYWIMCNRPEDFDPQEMAKLLVLLFEDEAPGIVPMKPEQ